MAVEEGWRELLLKMQVSELAKKYILSIDEEAKECFEKTLGFIQDRIKKEVLSAPLISSNNFMRNIIEKEMGDFVQTIISLMDYYAEGVYYSGKLITRKKLKLAKQQPNHGEKYSFTSNDKQFINLYKSNKLTQLTLQFDNAIVNYLVERITSKKIQGKWNLDGDEDYTHFEYSKQELSDEEMNGVIKVVENSFSGVFDEFMDAIAREIIQLFRRAQIEEFKNLGIDAVVFISEDESLCCPICNARSGKITSLSDSISDYGVNGGTNHSFCKLSIDPVISYRNQITDLSILAEVNTHVETSPFMKHKSTFLNKEIHTHIDFKISNFEFKNVPIEMEYRVIKLIKKFQIYAKQFMSDTTFVFVDNITDVDDWFQSVKTHYLSKDENEFKANNEACIAQDKLRFKIASFDYDNIYYVSPMSFDAQLIENMLVRKIVGDKITVTEWVKNRYTEKVNSKHIGTGIAVFQDPFISYLAQDTAEDYLIESTIAYVNQPNKLKSIDKSVFDYIKENIFNSVEFF
ncbi:MAG: hypothetical protein K0R18_471 [Bacillales bacterium]|jgi:hypothetical protein|nr:hypothetical protein [Bacillales bacterium]